MIGTIIVDDEAPARDELRYLLSHYPDLEIIGEAGSATEAERLIIQLQPELVFLDIQMPGCSGLELIASLTELPQQPHYVMVTAYDNYAVEAFEQNAIDYILKPISEKRLGKTINKIRNQSRPQLDKQLSNLLQQVQPSIAQVKKISVEKDGRMQLIPINEINYFLYDSGNIFVHTHNRALPLYGIGTMEKLEEHLTGSSFFRAHRSLIVNLDAIKEFSPWFNGKYSLIIDDEKGSELTVSRSRVKAFKQRLGI